MPTTPPRRSPRAARRVTVLAAVVRRAVRRALTALSPRCAACGGPGGVYTVVADDDRPDLDDRLVCRRCGEAITGRHATGAGWRHAMRGRPEGGQEDGHH